MMRWFGAALSLLGFSSLVFAQERAGLTPLDVKRCAPVVASSIPVPERARFEPYIASTRICPLVQTPLVQTDGKRALISLIAVFVEDYYSDKAEDAPWEDFPKPIFVDAGGRTVGALPEHFPEDPPRVSTLSFGDFRGELPYEIRVSVANPAIGGDYELPPLFWNPERGRYEADEAAREPSNLDGEGATCKRMPPQERR